MEKAPTKISFAKELILAALLVAFLHQLALNFYLYWTIEWFDILMHFLGGAWVGFGMLYILSIFGFWDNQISRKQEFLIFINLILSLLVIGLTWELWELFVGFSDRLNDRIDTILDIIMDLIGCLTAFYYGRLKTKIKRD